MIEETLCPECKAKMVIRSNKKDNSKFWGCPNFPKCKGTRDVMGRSKEEREEKQKLNDWYDQE